MSEQKRLMVSPSLAGFLQTIYRYYDKRPPGEEVMGIYEDALKGQGTIEDLEAVFRQWVVDGSHDRPPRASDLLALLKARKSGAQAAARHNQVVPELTTEEVAENRIRAAMAAYMMSLPIDRCGLRFEEWELAYLRAFFHMEQVNPQNPAISRRLADDLVRGWREERARKGLGSEQSTTTGVL